MTETSSETAVTVSIEGPVQVIRIDDGKANAVTYAMIDALHAALDQAENDDAVGAVAIIGRPGKFSAGFDLNVMRAGLRQAVELTATGARLGLRMFLFPKPIVLGCTGHALAMGAILLMIADVRIGASGDFKIGLNEVAIGMPVPRFAVELARDRLSKNAFVAAVGQATVYDPPGAMAAGYLDRVVDPDEVEQQALTHAATLATTLNREAFRITRDIMRGELANELQTSMDRDMKSFFVES